MKYSAGPRALVFALFTVGFLLSSGPAKAEYKTSMALSCPSGIFEAVLTIQLTSSIDPSLITPPTEWRCGSATALGTVRSVRYVFTTGFLVDQAIYKIVLPAETSGGVPQGQHGACESTVPVPSTTTCSGGVPTSVKGVAKAKLVLR